MDQHVDGGGTASMQMLVTRDALCGMEARGELEGFVGRLRGLWRKPRELHDVLR